MYELKRKAVVCLDSNVVIWGFVGEADRNNFDKLEKSRQLIEECSKLGVNAFIPSIVLAEVVSGCENIDKAAKLYSGITKKFRVAPFDGFAAYHYALLWQRKKELQRNRNQNLSGRRDALKADCMIIATAIALKAECIFTGNNEVKVFRELAQAKIQVEAPPGFSRQGELLDFEN